VSPRSRFIAARIGYVVIVLLGTLANLHGSSDLSAVHARLVRALSPSLTWRDAIDGLRNVVLFAGLGAVWVVTSLTGQAIREVRNATLVSLLLGAVSEALQLFSPVRTSSMLDVVTNGAGGLAGAVATVVLLSVIQRARRDKSYLGVPMLLIAAPYALAAECEALAPLFHSAPLPAMHGGPLTRLGIALAASRPLDWHEIPLVDVALFGAAGFLLVAMLRERGRSIAQSVALVSLGGAAIVVASHVLHGTFSLAVRWEAAAADAVSLVLGAWAARQWLAPITRRYRGASRPGLAMLAYGVLLAMWAWRPFSIETRWGVIAAQISPLSLTPLESLAQRVDVFSALHVMQQFLLYLPLGALLAVWPLRRAGRLAHLWPGVWLAAAVELGHIVVAGRTFDVTNFLLAASGLGVGWIAVRRCGYQPYGTVLDGREHEVAGSPGRA
jgi:glycopeptide antibiotics resistance protein